MNESPSVAVAIRPGRIGVYFAAALIVIAVAVTPLWVTSQYWLYLATTALIYAIVATGVNVTNGYLGMLNLAVAGQIGLGAYVCALLTLNHVPVPVAVMLAGAAGFLCSAGIFMVFGRLDGFFFGLSTLGAGEIIRLLLRNLEEFTNGVRGLRGYPELADAPSSSFWIVAASLLLIICALLIAIRSPVGLRWRAIRENPMKAAAAGVNVYGQKLFGYAVSGAIIALGGAYLALLMQYIDPFIADLKTLVTTILMVALGGPGTIAGPIIGAAVITMVPELLRVANEWRLIAYGLTLVAIVLVLPEGIAGTVTVYKRLRRKRIRRM